MTAGLYILKGNRRKISCLQLIFIVFQKCTFIVEKWEDFNVMLAQVMLEQMRKKQEGKRNCIKRQVYSTELNIVNSVAALYG